MNLASYTSFTFLIIISSTTFANSEIFQNNMDVTDLINNKIKENTIVKIPAGNFKIDAEKSIVLKNNVTIEMSPETILNVIPSNKNSYQVFRIHNVKNVKISGGTILGDKYTHLGNGGEWGMGVEVKDSQNVSISNMSINKMWGDAVYIGTNGKNSNYNLKLNNLNLDDNRRQGISIISVDNLIVNNVTISNTKGKSPMNGIDIEPHNKNNILNNIDFSKIKTFNNTGNGFQVSLKNYNGSEREISINMTGYKDYGSRMGVVINGLETPVLGKININEVDLKNNKVSNYCFKDWGGNKIKVNINNLVYDKEYVKNRDEWCSAYRVNDFLKITKKRM